MRYLTILLTFLAALPRSAGAQALRLPDTPVGAAASAYFDAFNSGRRDVIRRFVERYRTPGFLQAHPVSDRIEHQEGLRELFGHLDPVRVALSLDSQLTLLVRAAEIDGALVMRFQLDTANTRYLAHITTTGIDRGDPPDDYILYVANRAIPVDEVLRENTVRGAATALRNRYVYPAAGQDMAEVLERNLAEGAYDALTRAGAFADRLVEDLDVVTEDRHLWIGPQNPMAQASTDPENQPLEKLRQDHFGFRDAEVLPGNIGYLKFDMLFDQAEALDIAAAAMSTVTSCDGLILDLRDNIGGAWGTAGLILGYLLPPGTVFGYRYDRNGDRVEAVKATDSIPGEPFRDGIPVYVLTSRRTASAAEALAYTLKQSRRAIVVGEVSQGAAHPAEEIVLNPFFRMSVPILRSENLVTGTDWEGVGVIPDMKVDEERALGVALEYARREGISFGSRRPPGRTGRTSKRDGGRPSSFYVTPNARRRWDPPALRAGLLP